jgi:hypothetical protein
MSRDVSNDQYMGQSLGTVCQGVNNKCSPGSFVRHFREGSYNNEGKCYEFCANSNLNNVPDFKGGIAATSTNLFNREAGTPSILWPAARGEYNEFSKCCENEVTKTACDYSGSAVYEVTPFDYQTVPYFSAPGNCELTGNTVMTGMHPVNTTVPPPNYGIALSCNEDNTICNWSTNDTLVDKCPMQDSCVQWNPVPPSSHDINGTWYNGKFSWQTWSCITAEGMKERSMEIDPNSGAERLCKMVVPMPCGDPKKVLTDRCADPVCTPQGNLECRQCVEGFEIDSSKQGTTGVCQWTYDRNYWTPLLGTSCHGTDSGCVNGATPECQVVNNVTTPSHWSLNFGEFAKSGQVPGNPKLKLTPAEEWAWQYASGEYDGGKSFSEYFNTGMNNMLKQKDPTLKTMAGTSVYDALKKKAFTLSESNFFELAGLITKSGGAPERRYGFQGCGIDTKNVSIPFSRDGLDETHVRSWSAIADRSAMHPGGGAILGNQRTEITPLLMKQIGERCNLGITGWTNQKGVFDISSCTDSVCIKDGIYTPRWGDYGQTIAGECPAGLMPFMDDKNSSLQSGACLPGQEIQTKTERQPVQCQPSGQRGGHSVRTATYTNATLCNDWGPPFVYADSLHQFGVIPEDPTP